MRQGRKQAAGIRVARGGKEIGHRSRFDHAPGIHDRYILGTLRHKTQIMGHKKDRHSKAVAQIGDQIEDLRLKRDVERGGRFVRD